MRGCLESFLIISIADKVKELYRLEHNIVESSLTSLSSQYRLYCARQNERFKKWWPTGLYDKSSSICPLWASCKFLDQLSMYESYGLEYNQITASWSLPSYKENFKHKSYDLPLYETSSVFKCWVWTFSIKLHSFGTTPFPNWNLYCSLIGWSFKYRKLSGGLLSSDFHALLG